ncbi:hypothetical protein FA95DRAFT_1560657 [Auriscalpium vulgare]|uniref:Uncharacterized protein n=1 Tax=Auriscalpium vulgare TaxID=40419 RepID=A0ACB8RPG1_9AGAM|nr:hypothetical protein FA95DRAFT_1560657 [Auriscalpium vulgare]
MWCATEGGDAPGTRGRVASRTRRRALENASPALENACGPREVGGEAEGLQGDCK